MKKIKGIFSGVVAGIIFIIIGSILLWWNEGNNVRNIKTIEEARELLVNVENNKVEDKNEGKLVSTNGTLTIEDEFLTDSEFNVKVNKTAKLQRVVEVYQWEEDADTQNDQTVYTYKRVWSDELIDSSFFNDRTRSNPTEKPYNTQQLYANKVSVGAFLLNTSLLEQLNVKQIVKLDESVTLPAGYKIDGNYITNATELSTPAIGDVRISFYYNDDKEVSILAKQSGNSFAGFVSEQGKVLYEMRSGTLSGEEMIIEVEKENNMLKVILRIVGIILLVIGFAGLLSPISNVVSLVPLVGKHVSNFVNLIGGMIGLCVSLVIIAIAWIRFRPIVGISLLVGGALIIGLVIFLFTKSKKKAAIQSEPGVYSSSQVVNEQVNNQDMFVKTEAPQGATTLSSITNETIQHPNIPSQESINSDFNNNQNNNQ